MFFNKSVESKIIKKRCTGGSLPTGSDIRWNYFRATLDRLVTFFNQYKTCLQKLSTTSKLSRTVFKAKIFKVLKMRLFKIIFFNESVSFWFSCLKLQNNTATYISVNNTFREFRELIEKINLLNYLMRFNEIQETTSEVINKILIELGKRFGDFQKGYSILYQIFRKEFYKICSELNMC